MKEGFNHGQLYVALSRSTTASGLRIIRPLNESGDIECKTQNIEFPSSFISFFASICFLEFYRILILPFSSFVFYRIQFCLALSMQSAVPDHNPVEVCENLWGRCPYPGQKTP